MHTSLGSDLRSCWSRLIAGDNGIASITRWNAAEYTAHVAAEVREAPSAEPRPGYLPARSCKRAVRLFGGVAREAFLDAGLDKMPLPADEIGVAAGNSVSYLDMRLLKHYFERRKPGKMMVDLDFCAEASEQEDGSFCRRSGDLMASIPAKSLKLNGPCFVLDTACAASSHAIGEAFRLVARGRVTAMLAGGAAALVSPLSILAFALIGALSRSENPEEASRPFDSRRDGFVMGEGAGAVVLENMESARARGARIYAEIAGYASSLNAHSLADPSPSGEIEAHTMRMAMADAALSPEDVDYIAAHGTSTPKNDATETAAIKSAFGTHARRMLVSSNKGQIGHTISAAGVCNFICAVKAVSDSVVPPTMHLKNADPDCDLDYVANQSRQGAVRAALANAFAFGGQNAVLAVRAVGDFH
jgi:3-oxoacyl-[acyl-carrier-protein] synthase II